MTAISIDRRGVIRQDGQTADEWLSELFEYELCAECGRDADDHTVVIAGVGLFFARCDHPHDEQI